MQCDYIPVVHQQKLDILHVVNQKFDETAWQHMPRLLVRPVPNVGHQRGALEFTTNPRVDTLWPSPVCLQSATHPMKLDVHATMIASKLKTTCAYISPNHLTLNFLYCDPEHIVLNCSPSRELQLRQTLN